MPITTTGYAAQAACEPLCLFRYSCRDPGPYDVHVEIKYCGICHSDIHLSRDEWSKGIYPMVPGHEIVGVVRAIGSQVKKLAVGDVAAVGVFVDSCSRCNMCQQNQESLCPKAVWTYNDKGYDNEPVYGGYSNNIVVTERFAFKVPESLHANLRGVAPLLCAGITTYAPMKRWGMDKPEKKIGVIGLGGLGHMAVKFAVAWRNEVTVISTSPSKEEESRKILGATNFIVSRNVDQMKDHESSLDFLVDTVSAPKDMDMYLKLLKPRGILVTVGLPPREVQLCINPTSLVFRQLTVAGSMVGGTSETQEMLEFCGKENITALVEEIKPTNINDAFNRVLKSDVKYRFVVNCASLSNDA